MHTVVFIILVSVPTSHAGSADPRLLGALRKTVSPAGGGGGGFEEWMKCICPCYTPSRIALAEGARETVSLRGMLSARFFFFFFFQTRDCTTSTLQDFYIESVTAHRIKRNDLSCFHNSWPNSKSKLKLKHLWEQGGPKQPAYSAYREDRLCMQEMLVWIPLGAVLSRTGGVTYGTI